MNQVRKYGRLGWLAVGLAAGVIVSSLSPHTPLHAVSTDRAENLVMTTAIIDEGIEGVFVLDSMTGSLRGAVPSYRGKGAFQATWQRNVNADLLGYIKTFNIELQKGAGHKGGGAARPEIQIPQTPKYMMSSGLIDLRQGSAASKPGRSMLYVAEANSGVLMAYMVPWSGAAHSSGAVVALPLDLWAAAPFTSAVIRSEE